MGLFDNAASPGEEPRRRYTCLVCRASFDEVRRFGADQRPRFGFDEGYDPTRVDILAHVTVYDMGYTALLRSACLRVPQPPSDRRRYSRT